MPDPQYTFGPPGKPGSATPPPVDPAKQAYTFGPQGVAAKSTATPAVAAASPVAKPPVVPPTNNQPMFVVGDQTKIPGMVKPGNINLSGRPIIKNSDGSISSEYSFSFSDDSGHEILVPTIVNGKFLTPDGKKPKEGSKEEKEMYKRAQEHYEKTGETLGIFNTPDNADAYATNVHNRKDPRYSFPGQTTSQTTAVKPLAPPQPKLPTQAGVKPPGPFSSGVVSGMGFDPEKLQAATQFKLGDKLYSKQHPMTMMGAEVVKQAAKGMGDWMNAVIKDPAHLVDPLDSMARVVEFHTGSKWDAFGLHKAGIDETALDEIGSGIRSGDTSKLEHGAGKLVGGLSTIFGSLEAPEAGRALEKLPGTVKETAATISEARNKDVVTAAANNTLHNDVKTSIVPVIQKNMQAITNGIAKDAGAVAANDKAASLASGTSAFKAADIAQPFQDAVAAKNATKAPLPQTRAVLKAFVQATKKHGGDLSWEDVKDLRSQVFEAMNSASLKDKAVLGHVYDDLGTKLATRAKAVGASDEFESYSNATRERKRFSDGIINTLKSADTGLKTYKELAKASNQPELNDFFHLAEKNGGVGKSFVDDMVKTRKPIYELAARADAGEGAGGRMGAILRHPAAAGTAMVGTGFGLTMASPVPITGSFVASLVAAQKVANFMDRYDAVKAMRRIRGQLPPNLLKGTPTPFPGGPGGPSPTPPPGGGAAPATPPTAPSATSLRPVVQGGPALTSLQAPTGAVGAPPPPVSLAELQARISAAQRTTQAPREVMSQLPSTSRATPTGEAGSLPAELHKELEKQAGRSLSNEEAIALDRANAERGMASAGPDKLGDVREEHRAKLEAKGRSPEAKSKVVEKDEAKQTPYETFGVKIDKESLTTPEAVRAAKADAKAQIEELGRTKYKEIAKMSVGKERTAALAQLKKDAKEASRSVDKLQTPEVSRKQRDVLRKAIGASKLGHVDAGILANLSPEQVEQKAAHGVTNDEENLMEMVDLGRRAEAMGGQVEKVYQKIYNDTGGDPRTSLPRLRELFAAIDKAKPK